VFLDPRRVAPRLQLPTGGLKRSPMQCAALRSFSRKEFSASPSERPLAISYSRIAVVQPRQLRRVIDRLASGDVLMVTRLDWFARSTRDLLKTLAAIADPKQAWQ
jgi:hypothetical protein